MNKTSIFNNNGIYGNNKGQALLFVVVALTISMVVGVSVANRTLSMTKRVSSTDTQAKVYYAAEAGIERFAARPTAELIEISSGTLAEGAACGGTGSTYSGGACQFILGTTEEIQTKTSVTVEEISTNKTDPDRYEIRLKNGVFSSIYLTGFSGNLNLCWRDSTTDVTGLYYTLWGPAGLIRESIVLPNSGSVAFSYTGSPAAVGPDASGVYQSCTTVDTTLTPLYLHVMSMGGDAVVGVMPAGLVNLPDQGFLITSKGTLNVTDSQQQVVVIINATRSFTHIPGFFNAAIYAQGDIIAN